MKRCNELIKNTCVKGLFSGGCVDGRLRLRLIWPAQATSACRRAMPSLSWSCRARPRRRREVQRTEHLKDVLYEYYFEVGKEERHGDKTLIYLKCLRQINIPTVRWIYTLIRNIGQDLIPIFLFEKVNWNQRKKMLEDRISFCVLNKEIYIIG